MRNETTSRKLFQSEFRKVSEKWDQAESTIKHAERLNGLVVYPAVSELRYAGRFLKEATARYFDNPRDKLASEYLIKANQSIDRALGDSLDSAVVYMITSIRKITERLGYSTVMELYPETQNLIKQLDEVSTVIANSRSSEKKQSTDDTASFSQFDLLAKQYLEFERSVLVIPDRTKAISLGIRSLIYASISFFVLATTITTAAKIIEWLKTLKLFPGIGN